MHVACACETSNSHSSSILSTTIFSASNHTHAFSIPPACLSYPLPLLPPSFSTLHLSHLPSPSLLGIGGLLCILWWVSCMYILLPFPLALQHFCCMKKSIFAHKKLGWRDNLFYNQKTHLFACFTAAACLPSLCPCLPTSCVCSLSGTSSYNVWRQFLIYCGHAC